MSAPLITVRDLTVRYAGGLSAALDDIDLTIEAGERLAVIGESGSGKSTLALALAGLLPNDAKMSGKIDWPTFEHAPIAGRDIGFVFQDAGASLNPVLTIGEQIAEVPRRHFGLSWQQARRLAAELVARVRLPDPQAILDAYPHQVSGGQRQRVGIAGAIAAKPKLLIADEPTSALDMIVQAEIVSLLNELVREDGMTLLFVTHDIALASTIADRIAVFRAARLVEIGETRALLSRPQSDYTASLLAGHIDLDTPPLIAQAAA